MTKCPKCGCELKVELVRTPLLDYCTNEKCHGWYCFRCNGWHPYRTSCTMAEYFHFELHDQSTYDKWCKEHREDIFRMLKDSGFYKHWHDVYKYYPKDMEE